VPAAGERSAADATPTWDGRGGGTAGAEAPFLVERPVRQEACQAFATKKTPQKAPAWDRRRQPTAARVAAAAAEGSPDALTALGPGGGRASCGPRTSRRVDSQSRTATWGQGEH